MSKKAKKAKNVKILIYAKNEKPPIIKNGVNISSKAVVNAA
jgi:hypothetical protein